MVRNGAVVLDEEGEVEESTTTAAALVLTPGAETED